MLCIQIVYDADTQKAEPLQQGYLLLRCLVQNAMIEIHPTEVTVDV